MTLRAVLWDVGGPINTELTHERLIDEDIRSALSDAGLEVSESNYAAANDWAVQTYAPNAYKAIIWHLSDRDADLARDIYRQIEERSHLRNQFELREGIPQLLEDLHQRGMLLGLVANQPLVTLDKLDEFGVGRYFHSRRVSGNHGFRKPDIRLFLATCDELVVPPQECVLVGDRIDNDIAPANSIGMRTILLRTGRHRNQQPRSWDEVPDAEVRTTDELRGALFDVLDTEALG